MRERERESRVNGLKRWVGKKRRGREYGRKEKIRGEGRRGRMELS